MFSSRYEESRHLAADVVSFSAPASRCAAGKEPLVPAAAGRRGRLPAGLRAAAPPCRAVPAHPPTSTRSSFGDADKPRCCNDSINPAPPFGCWFQFVQLAHTNKRNIIANYNLLPFLRSPLILPLSLSFCLKTLTLTSTHILPLYLSHSQFFFPDNILNHDKPFSQQLEPNFESFCFFGFFLLSSPWS